MRKRCDGSACRTMGKAHGNIFHIVSVLRSKITSETPHFRTGNPKEFRRLFGRRFGRVGRFGYDGFFPILADGFEGVTPAAGEDLTIRESEFLRRGTVLRVLQITELHPERVFFGHRRCGFWSAVFAFFGFLFEFDNAQLELCDAFNEFVELFEGRGLNGFRHDGSFFTM
jgi:hypothetical protein